MMRIGPTCDCDIQSEPHRHSSECDCPASHERHVHVFGLPVFFDNSEDAQNWLRGKP